MKIRSHLTSAALLSLCAGSFAAAQVDARALDAVAADNAMNSLRQLHPGVRRDEGSLDKFVNTRLFGKRMTVSNVSPDDAASKFIARHADAMGVRNLELVQTKRLESATSNNVFFHYQQYYGGLPVEGTNARILVKAGDENAVVYAAGKLAPEPAGDINLDDAITADDAMERVRQDIAFKGLPIWHEAELVAYFNEAAGETTIAWSFMGGTGSNIPQARAFHFFVDAFTAEILEARNIIYNADVPTTVTGLSTPGAGADTASNPPVPMPISGLILENGSTGETAVTDANGMASVPNTGGPGVPTVSGSFNDGVWLNINDESGTPVLFESGAFADGIGGALEFGNPPSELITAQVNAFIHTNMIHDFVNTYAPGLNGVDVQLTTNVNINDSCNAGFSPFDISINFFTSGTDPFSGLTCNNTSFSSVVAHEYGHFIVNRLGLGQGQFGEGFGDVCSMLLYNEPLIGIDFRVDGGVVRDPVAADLQFPCSGGGSVHFCGQVLGALWWEIRENLGATYGDMPGLEAARELFGDWMLITGGGQGDQAVHPATAIEILVADDDDGNLDNGTPNYNDICAALGNRNIDCPPLAQLSISFDEALPSFLPANQASKVEVNIEEIAGQIAGGTAMLNVSIDDGPFMASAMTEISAGVFSADLPAALCTTTVDYFFSVEALNGETITSPSGAPATTFSAIAAESVEIPYVTEFEVDAAGFTAGQPGDTATTGQWVLGDPIGTVAQPENDNTPDPGVNCFFTGNSTDSGNQGANDVDGGFTTLVSPEIDLSAYDSATISYFRWYANDTGDSPNADTMRVDIREPGGAWTSVEIVGPGGIEASGGWFRHEFNVSDFVAFPATVQLRFIAEDAGAGSIVEAALDDLTVTGVSCVPVVGDCAGDCDGSGAVDFNDLVEMLFLFGQGSDVTCDADGSGTVDFNDLVATLFVFGPCPL